MYIIETESQKGNTKFVTGGLIVTSFKKFFASRDPLSQFLNHLQNSTACTSLWT